MRFVLLVFGLSVPFWILGALSGLELLPRLPISAMMLLCPVTAAAILVFRESGWTGVLELLRRSFDWRRIGCPWYVPIVLLMPAVNALAYWWIRLTNADLPVPRLSTGEVVGLLGAFLAGALAEELGWSGYLLGKLEKRSSPLRSAVAIGAIWAVWHFVPLGQAHRPANWIAWWSLGTVAMRVLFVWVYENAGKSVFAAAACHATQNVSWMLFPIHGSHWDPKIHGVIAASVAVFVAALSGRMRLHTQLSDQRHC